MRPTKGSRFNFSTVHSLTRSQYVRRYSTILDSSKTIALFTVLASAATATDVKAASVSDGEEDQGNLKEQRGWGWVGARGALEGTGVSVVSSHKPEISCQHRCVRFV